MTCYCTLKICFFVFNALLSVLGLALIVIGGLMIDQGRSVDGVVHHEASEPPAAAIALGSLILCLSLLGSLARIKEIFWLLLTYAVVLILVIVIEIVVGIMALVYDGEFEAGLEERMSALFSRVQNSSEAMETFSSIQEKFQCCGLRSYQDWVSVPASCCRERDYCFSYWDVGCTSSVTSRLQLWFPLMGDVLIAFAIVQIIGVVFSIFQAIQIRKPQGILA